MKKTPQAIKKTTKTLAPQATAAKHDRLYVDQPIQATRLFMKILESYANCTAVCYMAMNEIANTVTYCNAYAAKGSDISEAMPRSSYDPDTYTYPLKPKIVGPKMNEMIELEKPELWPSFVTLAAHHAESKPTRRRKATAK